MVEADGLTITEAEVGPWLHAKVLPVGALAVRVVDVPIHIVLIPEIFTTGRGNMVTSREAEAVQPIALVTVTLYVVATDGDTVTDAVVAPLLHTYDTPPEAVRVVDAPGQTFGPVMPAIGFALTLTVARVVAEHPRSLVTVTRYMVLESGDTVTEGVVAPVLH